VCWSSERELSEALKRKSIHLQISSLITREAEVRDGMSFLQAATRSSRFLAHKQMFFSRLADENIKSISLISSDVSLAPFGILHTFSAAIKTCSQRPFFPSRKRQSQFPARVIFHWAQKFISAARDALLRGEFQHCLTSRSSSRETFGPATSSSCLAVVQSNACCCFAKDIKRIQIV